MELHGENIGDETNDSQATQTKHADKLECRGERRVSSGQRFGKADGGAHEPDNRSGQGRDDFIHEGEQRTHHARHIAAGAVHLIVGAVSDHGHHDVAGNDSEQRGRHKDDDA